MWLAMWIQDYITQNVQIIVNHGVTTSASDITEVQDVVEAYCIFRVWGACSVFTENILDRTGLSYMGIKPSHPSHKIFTLRLSWRRYQNISHKSASFICTSNVFCRFVQMISRWHVDFPISLLCSTPTFAVSCIGLW